MKKIVLINQVSGPLFIDIANAFSSNGFETKLLTGQIEKTYAEVNDNVITQQYIEYDRRTSIKRILSWTIFTIQIFFKLLFSNHKQPLLLVSNPPMGPFVGLMMHKLFKQPYSVLIYDIYPDALVNFGVVKEDSFIVKIWGRLNRSLLNKADKVFTISKYMGDTLKTYYERHDNMVIIPNWVNNNFIKPIPKSENWFVAKHNLQDKFVVLYSGNMGVTHDIESIIEAADKLKSQKQIQFVLIGDGTKKEKIEQMINDKKLNNVLLLPFQDAEVVPFSMASADISIVTLAEGAGSLSVPSKTYYMMATGSAIIAVAQTDSELVHLVDEYKIGVSVTPRDFTSLASTIVALSQDTEGYKEYSKNALATSKQFTPKNAFEYVTEVLAQYN